MSPWKAFSTVVAPIVVGLALAAGAAYLVVEAIRHEPVPSGEPEPAPEPETAEDLRRFRKVVKRPAYWLGPVFDGMPVTLSRNGVDEKVVSYGTPELLDEEDPSGGLWVYPVQVATLTGSGADDVALLSDADRRLRGVPVYACRSCMDMAVFTGHAVVYVELGRDYSFRRLARALRPVHRVRPEPGPLPPPSR